MNEPKKGQKHKRNLRNRKKQRRRRVTRHKSQNILFYTSFFFATNVFSTLYKGYYLYSFLFLSLLITSLIYHSPSDNVIYGLLDKFFVLAIVVYGAHMLYNKYSNDNVYLTAIVVILFLYVLYVFIYGKIVSQCCFHKDKYIADLYHGSIHLTSSMGHHFITLL